MFTNAKAVLVASDSVHAQITAANLNFDHQHYAQAADYYRQSLASDPQNPALRTDLALSLSQFGNIDEALHEAQTVLAPNPDFVPALNLAATLNFRQGNNDAAIALWTHLLAVNPHFSGKNRVDALISLATQRKIAPK
ncbi:MAG TPA: tetratricopeptide repeat protein [Candidatus Koribacter sp.]|jgi:tetratricopeptide (TPR) repeat protein